MSSVNKLAIRGIRSFDDKQVSVIEFFSPVTVIVGHNGSGKTTIIECLKYATTGDQPPNTKGGAFIHDPKMANEKEVKAQVKLRFHAANGTRMLAVRNLSVTMKKNSATTMKTLESILALDDENKSGKRVAISTKCAEMDTEIPHLLGVSKSVLESVIFCHQEDSYWPLAEPAALKKKFDDIFEATRYTKALDSIKALRKDRVAELKAEKERLESLLREKGHADKLKNRISDLNATIASKEVKYEQTKKTYEQLVLTNKAFHDYATKFREMYVRIEELQKRKAHDEELLAGRKAAVQELDDTDEELLERQKNFEAHIAKRKQARLEEDSKMQDLNDELKSARKVHVELINEQGRLNAEAKAQEDRISEREDLVRLIGEQHSIRGYDTSPLDAGKVNEFFEKLTALQRQQIAEANKLEEDRRAKGDEYNRKSRAFSNTLEKHKQQKFTHRERVSKLQSDLNTAEETIEASQMLDADLDTLLADIDGKRARIEKSQAELVTVKYDERFSELVNRSRALEDKRDSLNDELRTLSLQAESRAKLDLKQSELKSKSSDLKNILQINSSKFRKFVGTEARAETMEQELDRVTIEKEKEYNDMEIEATLANRNLHEAETTLSSLKSQLDAKKQELKNVEQKLKDNLYEHDSVEAAMKVTNEELDELRGQLGTMTGARQLYETFLKLGQSRGSCALCMRHMNADELAVFEKSVKEKLQKTSASATADDQADIDERVQYMEELQKLIPVESARASLKDVEIPALIRQIQEKDQSLPAIAEVADKAAETLNTTRKELKELALLRQHANNVSRLLQDIERLSQEIPHIQIELSASGSAKTATEIQEEIDVSSTDLRSAEREKQNLLLERERRRNAIQGHQNDLHSMQLREGSLRSQIREKAVLTKSMEEMRKEIASLTVQGKKLEAMIQEGQAPIDLLDQGYEQVQKEFTAQYARVQEASQDINKSVDKLENINRSIERYVRDRRARKLQETGDKIEKFELKIQDYARDIERVRESITLIEKEINEGGALQARIRDNLFMRDLADKISETQTEIDSMDMEEAAKAKRNFEEKYPVEKQKETEMQSLNAHTGGELQACKGQLKQLEKDLREYKGIDKKYTEQLIKVKMSDMANNDLEKYAKALDNAIMKYHSLKMEEVNDIMKHLWNKTYQGTDIDGIKIRSDSEGGASKRSYNYRVVMTKDQVEMDMRGRCSAGQKMLASIIIRLALSDSFGQNCGILALDEPTNALDMENIDALAASLVDIINERKNHANFQLIIITHDENFLRKLGQSDISGNLRLTATSDLLSAFLRNFRPVKLQPHGRPATEEHYIMLSEFIGIRQHFPQHLNDVVTSSERPEVHKGYTVSSVNPCFVIGLYSTHGVSENARTGFWRAWLLKPTLGTILPRPRSPCISSNATRRQQSADRLELEWQSQCFRTSRLLSARSFCRRPWEFGILFRNVTFMLLPGFSRIMTSRIKHIRFCPGAFKVAIQPCNAPVLKTPNDAAGSIVIRQGCRISEQLKSQAF
ncbi:hypothetical protein EW146_g1924 [Bondarzewia mesenterica]|uniref:DNA repair protein RAD50 n=1 Tax=Bondarzewia mesenterica TaxID=1095465 RepID=A0A4S4M2S8_9AGAM|nr:hypothetical protein EW146_g1924 [Bondarzewia mesenterica]